MNYLEELCQYLEERGCIDHEQVLNVYWSLMPSLVPPEEEINEEETPWEADASQWNIDVPDKAHGGRGAGRRSANRKAIKAPDLDALLPEIVLQDAQLSSFFPMLANGKAPKARPSWEQWADAVAKLYAMDDAALSLCLDKLLSGRPNIWRKNLLDILQFYERTEFFPVTMLHGYSGPSVSAFLTEIGDYTAVSFTTKKYNWLYVENERIRCLRQALIVRNRLRISLISWLRLHAETLEVQSTEQLLSSDHGFLVSFVRNHRLEAERFFKKFMEEHSNPEVLCELIEIGGFNPNYTDSERKNILFWCPDELVSRLIADGADPLRKNFTWASPLDFAIENDLGNRFILLFESKEAQLRYAYKGKTLLEKAINMGCWSAVGLLLDDPLHAKDIKTRNFEGRTPLFSAVWPDCKFPYSTNQFLVELLLSHGADANAVDNNGVTPLHLAVKDKDSDIIRILLEHGANPNIFSTMRSKDAPEGYSPVMLLVEEMWNKRDKPSELWSGYQFEEYHEMLRLLVKYSMNADVCLEDDNLPLLHRAAEFMTGQFLKLLLMAGANPNRLDDSGQNALFHVTKNESFALVALKVLLADGAQVNIQDNQGDTPLIVFCREAGKDLRFLKILLKAGADVNISNNEGTTALHVLCMGKVDDFEAGLQLLLKAGADVNISNHKGVTALHELCMGKVDDFEAGLQLLLKAGADVNAKNHKGDTPLHIAVYYELSPQNMQFFISNGKPDLELKNSKGQTPLHCAAACFAADDEIEAMLSEKLQFLLDAGAKINVQDNQGNTPLHNAALCKEKTKYNILLKAGANPTVKNLLGETPEDYLNLK